MTILSHEDFVLDDGDGDGGSVGDDDGGSDGDGDDGDLYIIGAVCVSVSKSHYLCIQRICFQTLLNSRDLFVSHVYRQLDNKNPKMYIKIPRCS